MKTAKREHTLGQRLFSLLLTAVLVLGMVPVTGVSAATGVGDGIDTWADPQTLTRPETIYGDNTLNTGKITVGKSVSAGSVTLNGQTVNLTDPNNFLVTVSQSAQVMGLSSESSVPVDVVFVLDTSGSMDDNERAEALVEAANSAIATLMAANEANRVGVVAFSSAAQYWNNQWSDWGGGTAGGKAANVLSSLKHYTGEAATAHLTWVNSSGAASGNSRGYIAGRDTVWQNNKNVRAFRNGKNGGTNIQAGVALGAQMLTSVTDTTYTNPDTNTTVTRIPFLIIISDGQPTYVDNAVTWYNPAGNGQLGPGSGAYEGNGFMSIITAAYYKGLITEHYYGSAAGAENHCFVYTMGVEIAALDDYKNNRGQTVSAVGDNESLAQITLDPATYTTGTYAAANAVSYYRYGNTWDGAENDRRTGNSVKTYWQNFVAGNEFTVRTNSQENYTFTAASIEAGKKYVNGIGYTGGLAYNDRYFAADDVADMERIFQEMLQEIQMKAVSVPTKVTTGDHDFDGYISFYDPIGEYMEVKAMKGILAGGKFFQGASAAQYMTSGTNTEFNAIIRDVLATRMHMTQSTKITAEELLTAAKASANQAYYNSPSDYNNSIVWWGSEYETDEEDPQVQVIGFADNDSIEYIEAQRAAGAIPADADYVCRSYFYYGEAGVTGTKEEDYLYFIVRVQRSLTAPYQQTVVISAPASLLSMEKVLITEESDGTYSAEVVKAEPARVVYEVGLQDHITAETVNSMISADYTGEQVNGIGQVNYDPVTGTYYFFTNDWDRSEGQDSHHRAMAHATFDAATDNPFYTYQEDTLVVDINGNAVKSDPAGTTAYYVRTYYDWSEAVLVDGVYTDVDKKTQLIQVDIPAGTELLQKDGKWYIPKGTYTNATLVVNGDDTQKITNVTGTSVVVSHPHRTGTSSNSHYTVLLGNNGVLSLQAADTKFVSNTTQNITDADGKAVMVGDILTYTIHVRNSEDTLADAVVTDSVPAGTELVEDSVSHGGTVSNGKITWNLKDLAAESVTILSFKVRVTEAALDDAVITVENTAIIQLGNNPAYRTNTTKNPPEGKEVTGGAVNGTVTVGQTLTYTIDYTNDQNSASTITIADKIPAGTTYVEGTASHGGVYDAATKTITWTLNNVGAGVSGKVTFKVLVDITAVEKVENAATIQIGNNDPKQTNKTTTTLLTGDLVLNKTVVIPAGLKPAANTFTLKLTEAGSIMGNVTLNGKFAVEGASSAKEVEFVNGVATLQIKHGERITVKGLPAGAQITVTETVPAGFTASIPNTGVRVTVDNKTAASVSITNTYAVTPVIVTLEGNKKLTGTIPHGPDTFGFTAVPCNAQGVPTGAAGVTGEAVLNSGEKTISFGHLTFNAPGTYYYLISEVNGGQTGVTYDATEYLVTITVKDNGDGTLSATTTLASRTGNTGAFTAMAAGDEAVFTNVYQPLPTSVTLTGDKILTGRDQKDEEFTFVVTDANGNVVSVGASKAATNGAAGDIIFAPISYSAPGTYTYTVTEVAGSLKGVAYSSQTFQITVTVEDVDGKLQATVAYPTGGVVFTNVYTPDDISVTLEGKKQLSGGTLTAEAFAFVVKDGATVVATGNNDAAGNILFTPITFTKAMLGGADSKVFTYVISELVPDVGRDPNLYYDPTDYQVRIEVTCDSSTGLLNATILGIYELDGDGNRVDDVTDSVVFENIQNPASVELRPAANKTTPNAPAGVTFSYSVINTASGNQAAVGVGPANGAITFSEMSYSEEGTYTYWILENNGGSTLAGITYDNTRYLMVVKVTRNATNKLETTVAYYASAVKGSANVADYTIPLAQGVIPQFTNTYGAQGSIDLTATKVLRGRELKAGEFSFYIKDSAGNVAAAGTVDAQGKVSFSTLFFDRSDIPNGQTQVVLPFTLAEAIPESAKLPGVVYDTNEYPIFIKLTDNGDGTLKAELVADANGTALNTPTTDTGVTFTNKYNTVVGTSITLEGMKVLEGRDLKAGEFSFRLYHVSGTAETLVDTATNDANGYFYFVRHYVAGTTAGDYKYILREYNSGSHGMSYATNEYEIIVTVIDNADGTLSAKVTKINGTAFTGTSTKDALVFNNTYTPDDVSVTLEGTKELTGADLTAEAFAFVVEDASGKVVSTGNNAANGKIAFTPIVYSKTDLDGADSKTFTYWVRELKPSVGADPTLYYDPARYEVTVTVSYDSVKGKLNTQVTYEDGDIVFKNIQNPGTISVVPTGFKTITGSNVPERLRFSFRVVAMGSDLQNLTRGQVEGTGVSAGEKLTEDAIHFTTLVYDAEDIGTYYYIIEEVIPGANTVDYDTIQYVMEVTIGQDAKQALTKSVKYYTVAENADPTKAANWTAFDDNTKVLFENDYSAFASLNIFGTKTLTGRDLEEHEFDFRLQLLGKDGKLIPNTMVDGVNHAPAVEGGSGQINFGTLLFTEEQIHENFLVKTETNAETGITVDTYQYRTLVTEIKPETNAIPGVTYSTEKYIVIIEWEITTDSSSHSSYGQPKVVGVYAAEQNGEVYTYDSAANLLTDGKNVGDVLTFTNRYAPKVGTGITIEGTKVLTGRDLKTGEFSFRLYHVDGTVETLIDTATNDEDGYFYFTRSYAPSVMVGYGEERTVTYILREYNNGIHGVSYATNEYEITVVITDNGDSTLSAKIIKINGDSFTDESTKDAVVFANHYTPAEVPVVLEGTKVLTGAELTAEAFAFVVEDAQGNIVATGNNAADKSIVFTPIYYGMDDLGGAASKTFTYWVRELVPSVGRDPNLYYDPARYEVTVTVTYDSATGELKAEETYVDGEIVFHNIQNPAFVEVTPKGVKTTHNAPTGTTFSYSVFATSGSQTLVATGTSQGNGPITFGTLSFAEEGTYTYWIVENYGGTTHAGVTYDAARYLMVVSVTRNNTSKLEATVTYYRAGDVVTGAYGDDPAQFMTEENKVVVTAFSNVYGAEGMINITAKKVLTNSNGGNRQVYDGVFAFKLVRKDAQGNVIDESDGIVSADGTVTFATLFFTLDDIPAGEDSVVLTYIMSEVIPDAAKLPGIVYDENTYEVYIKLTDNEDGTLTVELVKDAQGTALDAPTTDSGVVFVNDYKIIKGIDVIIEGSKTLNGRDLADGEFSFGLYHVNGNEEKLVDTATNVNGEFLFKRSYSADILKGYANGQRVIRYIIREIPGHLGGVIYDGAEVHVTVTVEDAQNNGELTYSVVYTDEEGKELSNAAFTNIYQTADTLYTPVADKVLNGRDQKNDEFSFVVKDLSSGQIVSTGLSKSAASGVAGSVVFTPIAYTFADMEGAPLVGGKPTRVFTYSVSEVAGQLTNVVYTDAVYYMTVTVVDNGDGTMTATAKYYSDAACTQEISKPVFTNGYTPTSTTAYPEATKTLTGRAPMDGEFSFVVKNAAGQVVATGGNYDGVVRFSGIGFTAADMGDELVKTFIFTMEELTTGQGGVRFDDTVYTVEIEVTNDLAEGKLEVTDITYKRNNETVSAATFANAYESRIDVVLEAEKTLVGKTLAAGEFKFELLDKDGNVIGQTVNGADGKVSFPALTYTQEDLKDVTPDASGVRTTYFTYSIREVEGSGTAKDKGTYTYDPTVYDVTVELKDNGKGNLDATVTYTKRANTRAIHVVGSAEFLNYYTPNAIVNWELPITAEKVVLAPDGSGYELDTFHFQVTNTVGEVIATGTNDANGVITFNSTITLTNAGWYYFRITEIPDAEPIPGITYDTTVWEVHVQVRYDELTGQLYVNREDIRIYELDQQERAAQDKVVFTNVYQPASVDTVIRVKKSLTGRDLAAGEFTFHIGRETELGDLIQFEAHNDADGWVTFRLTYTEAGTYEYVIHELKPETPLGGITYDETVYHATVVVTDDGSGQLKVASQTVTDSEGNPVDPAVFNNTYATESADVTLEAIKELAGRDMTAGEFTFILTDSEGNEKTKPNAADGKVTFDTLTFHEVGTYVYTVAEAKGSNPGMTYDETLYTVTITVTDNGKGKLVAAVSYTENGVKVPALIFTNTYKGQATTVDVEAEKVLTGKDLIADEFSFTLVNKDNSNESYTAKNGKDGSVTFENLTFTEAGVYTYLLSEVKGDDANTSYDETVYTVVITVTDDGDGQLKAEVQYLLDGKEVDQAKFTNVYTPDPVVVPLVGSKDLTGRDQVAGEFTFEVRDGEGNLITTGTNTADGKIVFEEIKAYGEGEIVLYVTEVAGDAQRMEYDDYTYRVKITVTNNNGVLEAKVTYLDGEIVFYNVYLPEVPITGDNTPVALYAGLLASSLMALAAVLVLFRKKEIV